MNEAKKNMRETPINCPDFSMAPPLDFCGEKEHFEDKPTLWTRSH